MLNTAEDDSGRSDHKPPVRHRRNITKRHRRVKQQRLSGHRTIGIQTHIQINGGKLRPLPENRLPRSTLSQPPTTIQPLIRKQLERLGNPRHRSPLDHLRIGSGTLRITTNKRMLRPPTKRAVTPLAEPENPPKAMEGSAIIVLYRLKFQVKHPITLHKYTKLFCIINQ